MAVELFPVLQWLNGSGAPLAGGKISTYAAGTTTPLATYTDSTGATPNSNPAICDAAGRVQLWFSAASYKLVVKDASDVTQLTVDGIKMDNLAATIASLTSTGAITMQQPVAATGSANQSSAVLHVQGTIWDGSTSVIDDWTVQNIVGAGANPTSSLSIQHSGSSGVSTINYAGTSSLGALTSTVSGSARLNTDNSNYVNIFSGVRPIQPAPQSPSQASGYPAGNDLALHAVGCADIHLTNEVVDVTATTSLAIGANASVVTGSNLLLSHASGVSIIIEPGTAKEESVSNANWSVVDSTHLSITAAQTHTQPYTIRQQGSIFLDNRQIIIQGVASGGRGYIAVTDNTANSNNVMQLPTNTGAAWPAGAIALTTQLTGSTNTFIPAPNDLIVRNASSTKSFRAQKSTGTDALVVSDTIITASVPICGIGPSFQKFTANGTFTIPTGITKVKVTTIAAGGAGGGASAANWGSGGGAGGHAISYLSGLTPANTIAVTVGTGGAGVSNATGGTGGNSTLASGTQTITTVTALGGVGGVAVAGVNPGGAGGAVSTNGDINAGGNAGQFASANGQGGPGGSSILGGAGIGGGASAAGSASTGPGSGGGGAGQGANNAGGAGANGIVIFEWTT